jgi:3-phenylpropionate/cinnamic acid dioxygenase small subunit
LGERGQWSTPVQLAAAQIDRSPTPQSNSTQPSQLGPFTLEESSMPIHSDSDLPVRLERLEDHEAINRLFVDYGHLLDERDWPKLAVLFAEDAEVILEPLGRATGRSAIRNLFEQGLSSERGRTFHIIANPLVTITDKTAASDVSWAMIARLPDGRPTLAAFGRHHDRLVKVDGGWKFQRREGVTEMPASMPMPLDQTGAVERR